MNWDRWVKRAKVCFRGASVIDSAEHGLIEAEHDLDDGFGGPSEQAKAAIDQIRLCRAQLIKTRESLRLALKEADARAR